MDVDPGREGLDGQDPPKPPVSPHPRGEVLPGVPKKCSVPVSCSVSPSGGPGRMPRLEVLQKQVHSLQKVHRASVQELAKARDHSEGLRQQLEQLEQRKEALEESQKKVQESLQRAQLHRKEMEAKGQRRYRLFLEQHQNLEETEQKWEQLQHLRREQRWQYCQQLDAIMEELKHLRVTHTPAHLKAELMQLEKMEEKLLSWERRLMEMEEQLGPEALVVMRWVQQELESAEQQLQVELGRQQLSLQRRDRLAEELQQLKRSLEAAAQCQGQDGHTHETPVAPE